VAALLPPVDDVAPPPLSCGEGLAGAAAEDDEPPPQPASIKITPNNPAQILMISPLIASFTNCLKVYYLYTTVDQISIFGMKIDAQ
jgi:hypothetical protein